MAFAERNTMHATSTELALKFENRGGFWIAAVSTRYGVVEVMVGGTGAEPDDRQLVVLKPFFARATEITESTKKKIPFSFLYRLIRVTVNPQDKVGLQFRNRLTGSQPLIFLDDKPNPESCSHVKP